MKVVVVIVVNFFHKRHGMHVKFAFSVSYCIRLCSNDVLDGLARSWTRLFSQIVEL